MRNNQRRPTKTERQGKANGPFRTRCALTLATDWQGPFPVCLARLPGRVKTRRISLSVIRSSPGGIFLLPENRKSVKSLKKKNSRYLGPSAPIPWAFALGKADIAALAPNANSPKEKAECAVNAKTVSVSHEHTMEMKLRL
jgi:hypothetical protein